MIGTLNMVKPFLGLYALETGGGLLLVGVVYAANPLASFAVRIPGAALSNKYGKRNILASGLALHGVGLLLYSTSTSPSVLILSALIQGTGFGLFHPVMLSAMTQSKFGHLKQEEVVAYISTSVAVGQTLGPAIGSFAIILGGFRTLFFAAGLANLTPIILCYAALKQEAGSGAAKFLRKGVLSNIFRKDFIVLLYSRTSFSYVQGAIVTFLPLFAADRFQLSKTDIGLLFTFAAIFNFIARPLVGQIAFRFGEKILIQIGCAQVAAAALVTAFAPHPSFLWLTAALYGMSLGFFVPSSILYVGKMFPSDIRTISMAFLTIMIDAGQSMGSAASAGILARADYFALFGVAALIGFTSLGASSTGIETHKESNSGKKTTS